MLLRPLYLTRPGPPLALTLVAALTSTPVASAAERPRPLTRSPSVVKVLPGEGGGWRLTMNGKPHHVRGGGGEVALRQLVAHGGNSVRTWGAGASTNRLLSQSAKLGVSVCVGLWLKPQRHGFDYRDSNAVARQKHELLASVKRLKVLPAVLMWGIGNELDLESNDPVVWDCVNDIAKAIHEIDGNHPTMTVICSPNPGLMSELVKRCPDIDVLGINSYGGLIGSYDRIRDGEWKKPILVTEYGPDGHWEAQKTSWGALIEDTSADKLKLYHERTLSIQQQKDVLGGYAFLWGQKQERTATWFSLVLDEKYLTAPVDGLARAWTGDWPRNRAPTIKGFTVDGKTARDDITLAPNTVFQAQVVVEHKKPKSLNFKWELRHETSATSGGGDREAIPPEVKRAIGNIGKMRKSGVVEFRTPREPGKYRLFVYVRDGNGKMGYANCPILVESSRG